MKLVLYNEFRPGALAGDTVVDLSPLLPDLAELEPGEVMPAVIERFSDLRPRIADLIAQGGGRPLADVRLRSPLARPRKFLCAAGNYREHGQRPPGQIDFFFKSPESFIGNGDTVVLPPHQATIFHHEAEIAVVIGKAAKNLQERNALDAVFGYTGFIDVSGRNLGRPAVSTFFGKSFDTFGPLGPCIVTLDEVADIQKLQVRLWVNGQLRQDYNTDDMAHPVTELLAWLTGYMALRPGDAIACGTNHQGLGAMQDGDVVDLEVGDAGRLRVNVVDALKREWPRGIDEATAARARAPRA